MGAAFPRFGSGRGAKTPTRSTGLPFPGLRRVAAEPAVAEPPRYSRVVMNWLQARRLLRRAGGHSAAESGSLETAAVRPATEDGDGGERVAPAAERSSSAAAGVGAVRAASLCIASGKGGTGKSVVTASLAQRFAVRGRTLVLDADLGVGNAHILQDLSPDTSLVDVVEGRRTVRSVVQACGERLDLIAGGCGVSRMAGLSAYELHVVAAGLEELEREYAYLLVDSAAGISVQTMSFAVPADIVLIVTTPDLTAMTDAYAFLKVLTRRRPEYSPLLVVNRAEDEPSARRVAERIGNVATRFLGTAPRYVGWLPDDPAVTRSVNRRAPVVDAEPNAPWSLALDELAVRLLEQSSSVHPRGLGAGLLRRVGYGGRAR